MDVDAVDDAQRAALLSQVVARPLITLPISTPLAPRPAPPPPAARLTSALHPQMQHFGQTPCQLWRERPHPKRSASAAVNTIQVVPLLVALAAEQQLASTREQLLSGTVRFLAAAGSGRMGVGVAGGAAERTFASCHRSCLLVVQTQQLLQYGFADGTVRSLAPRKSAGGAACCFHGLHFGEPVNAACITSGAPPRPPMPSVRARRLCTGAPCTAPHRASPRLTVCALLQTATPWLLRMRSVASPSGGSSTPHRGASAWSHAAGWHRTRPPSAPSPATPRSRSGSPHSPLGLGAQPAARSGVRDDSTLCKVLNWRWQVLASAGDDGSVHLWDLRRLRLLHVLQVHPHATPAGAGPSGRVVAMQIKEETGELALATHDQLQLWSINAALLAVRACARSRSSMSHLLLRGWIAPVLACR